MIFQHIIDQIIKKFSATTDDIVAKQVNIINCKLEHDFTIEILGSQNILDLLAYLQTEPTINCQQLIDLCIVDYLQYGKAEWDTQNATRYGFGRAIDKNNLQTIESNIPTRFAVVYHLLSHTNNLRIRIKCFLDDADLTIPSCVHIWPSANWYEREAFDLFGINFIDHPNLTRILTDDNFEGFPLRKDFPLSGNYEVEFAGATQQVVRKAVDIENYNIIPKVIRNG